MRCGISAQLLLLTAVGVLTGCQSTTPTVANPVPIEAQQYATLYDAAIEVLRETDFQIEQRDYRFGEITTEPKGSPTVVEAWRDDNATAEQAWLSTLSDVRRRVQVQLEPADAAAGAGGQPQANDSADAAGAADYLLRVKVLMERRQVPVRRLTGSVRGGVFSRLEAVPAEWRRRGIEATYWEPIGRDRHLEQRLIQRILRQSQQLRPSGAG